jgi:hypothetical protein
MQKRKHCKTLYSQQPLTAPKTYAGDIKAFAKAVPSGKTFIYALQMSIKHLALLKAFRQTVFQIRTSSSCKPLGAIAIDTKYVTRKST